MRLLKAETISVQLTLPKLSKCPAQSECSVNPESVARGTWAVGLGESHQVTKVITGSSPHPTNMPPLFSISGHIPSHECFISRKLMPGLAASGHPLQVKRARRCGQNLSQGWQSCWLSRVSGGRGRALPHQSFPPNLSCFSFNRTPTPNTVPG